MLVSKMYSYVLVITNNKFNDYNILIHLGLLYLYVVKIVYLLNFVSRHSYEFSPSITNA